MMIEGVLRDGDPALVWWGERKLIQCRVLVAQRRLTVPNHVQRILLVNIDPEKILSF